MTLQAQLTPVTCTTLLSWYEFHTVALATTTISLRLFNSAWTSTIKEMPGTMTFPTHLLPPLVDSSDLPDLALAVIHHPLNWYSPETRRDLSRYLENSSDIIMTGHEHVSGFATKLSHPGPNNEFIEGGVLQETMRPDDSTFNVLQINLADSTQQTQTFTWSKSELQYRSPRDPSPVRHFQTNHHRMRFSLPFTTEFDKWLDDPGFHFSHPTKQRVLLEDIFIEPDFREVSTSDSSDTTVALHGTTFLDTVLTNKHLLVYGPEISGKTTLAKRLMRQVKSHGFMPLYLDGGDSTRSRSGIARGLADSIRQIYGDAQLDRFEQLPAEQRALIIDNYQSLPLDPSERQSFLTRLAARFAIVVVFATDDVRLEEFTAGSETVVSLWEFKHLEILEFGFAKRSELCRKWYGSSAPLADVSKAQSLFAKTEAQLSAVIGEQVIPAFPLFLLMLLQQLAIAQKDTIVSGSVGYLYQAMVIRDLERATTKQADIDTNRNYLAEFAYRLFTDSLQQLSLTEFGLWHNSYCQKYRVQLDAAIQRASLSDAGLLVAANGMIRFHYPYLYYYFVAEYLAAHIADGNVQQQIRTLTTFFHQTEAANVVLFLCYKSRDSFILDAVCDTASRLFDSRPCCELDDDVKTLPIGVDVSDVSQPPQALISGNPEENRQVLLLEADEMFRSDTANLEQTRLSLDAACDLKLLNEQLQLSSALKTIQIIGQILKNHVGSLEGDVKTRLVAVSTALGLRSMHTVVNALKGSLEEMVRMAVVTYERKHGALPMFKRKNVLRREKIAESVNRSLWNIAQMGVVAIVKYISESLGSERLAQTYSEVFSGVQPPAVATVDL